MPDQAGGEFARLTNPGRSRRCGQIKSPLPSRRPGGGATPGEVTSSVSTNGTVLLIGASRGLGYAIAAEYCDRGSHVVATVRRPDRTALHELQGTAGGRLEIEQVDINAPEQVQTLRDRLAARRFDLLFVNAGVTNEGDQTTANVSTEEFTRLMVTNALSPMRVIETLGELIDPKGTIAVMSSGQGAPP